MSTEQKGFPLRLDEDLRARLDEASKVDQRSINYLINHILRLTLLPETINTDTVKA